MSCGCKPLETMTRCAARANSSPIAKLRAQTSRSAASAGAAGVRASSSAKSDACNSAEYGMVENSRSLQLKPPRSSATSVSAASMPSSDVPEISPTISTVGLRDCRRTAQVAHDCIVHADPQLADRLGIAATKNAVGEQCNGQRASRIDPNGSARVTGMPERSGRKELPTTGLLPMQGPTEPAAFIGARGL